MKTGNSSQKEEQTKLMEKVVELADDIREEYDMMELVEDSIKDVFECNLECMSCSEEDRGKCMQNFKKMNIYWMRKIVQDERFIKSIVTKLDELNEIIDKKMRILQKIGNEKVKDLVVEDDEDEFDSSDIDQEHQASLNKKTLKKVGEEVKGEEEKPELFDSELFYA